MCVNPEDIPLDERASVERELQSRYGIPCADSLERPEKISEAIEGLLEDH